MKVKSNLLIYLFSFFLSANLNSNAQSPGWEWAKRIGGLGSDECYKVKVDPSGSGDIYITGSYEGTVDFDPGPLTTNITNQGQWDVYLAKLDSSGNYLWARGIGGIYADHGTDISIDDSGNVYLTGWFDDTAYFNPGNGPNVLIAKGWGFNMFICKYGKTGDLIWAKSIGGPLSADVISYGMINDKLGNIYTTGSFTKFVDFNPDTTANYNLFSSVGSNIFICRWDSSGNFNWAKSIGTRGGNRGYSISTDPTTSEIYITGTFSDTVDFDPGPGIFKLVSVYQSDIFVCKFDSAGNFVWAKAVGGTGNQDVGYSIAFDTTGPGALYVTGDFQDTADFDPGAGIFTIIASSPNYKDAFILKLDSSGSFKWAQKTGGALTDGGKGVAIGDSGNIYLFGMFQNTIDADPSPISNYYLTSTGDYDLFISKLDSSGGFLWAKRIGGTSQEEAFSIAIDPHNNNSLYVAGDFFSGSLAFGASIIFNADISGNGNDDIYVARLGNISITGVEKNMVNSQILFYPNPAKDHFLIDFGIERINVEIAINDISGKELISEAYHRVKTIHMQTNGLTAGIYLIQIKSDDFVETKKLIVAR